MSNSGHYAGIFFYDDFMLDRRVQAERVYFSPKPFSEPYYDPEHLLSYPVAQWCPEIGKYRAWYSLIGNHKTNGKNPDENDGKPLPDHFLLALAESKDGIHWRAAVDCGSSDPKADIFPHVVYSGLGEVHGSYVFRDERDPDPARRYKCAGASLDPSVPLSQINANCIVAVSPDGVHWDEREHEMRWSRTMSDTVNCMFYNPVRGVYQIIHRAAMTDRRIHSTTSRDLIHWSEPELILHPDPFDPPCSQFYGMVVYPSAGVFVGILQVYHTDMFDDSSARMRGTNTMELVYSYDGLHWNRTHHTLYASLEGMTYVTAIKPDRSDEGLLLTCLLQNTEHGLLYKDDSKRRMGMRLDTMRLDGFAGLRSIGHASILTKPVRLLAPELLLNANASLGEISVQLSDWEERPIPGYTFEDCLPFCGDSVRHAMAWKGHDLEELVGRIIRVEVKFRMSIIYAIYGNFNPHHTAVPITSYGNPKPVFDNLSRKPDTKWWLEKDASIL